LPIRDARNDVDGWAGPGGGRGERLECRGVEWKTKRETNERLEDVWGEWQVQSWWLALAVRGKLAA